MLKQLHLRLLNICATNKQHLYAAVITAFIVLVFFNEVAFAQDVSDVADNVTSSLGSLPGLISALAYLTGIFLAVQGVLALKRHVENPGSGRSSGQVALREPLIYFLVGGLLFSLPIAYEAMHETISGGSDVLDVGQSGVVSFLSGLNGLFSGLGGLAGLSNVSSVLYNIIKSLEDLPGLVAAVAYLLGLVIGFTGLLKLKEYGENPDAVKISEIMARFATAGALFALPTIFTAMYETINNSDGLDLFGLVNGIFSSASFFSSSYGSASTTTMCDASQALSSTTLGQSICGIVIHTGAFPAFLIAMSYLFGVILGFWGILKLRDHVLNPQQNTIFQGLSRLFAGGMFFALPVMINVFKNSIISVGSSLTSLTPTTGFNDGGFTSIISGLSSGSCPSGLGLDGMLVCFAADILGPVHVVLNFFAYVAGIIFIMIGISRMLKGEQEGAKAPGGLGTMMTFFTGGALIAYNELIRAVTATMTGSTITTTQGTIAYADEATGPAAHAVVSSIIKFMIVIGLISFVRGLFIVRSVAEGNQQASMMAGLTHIIGGVLAVNLGPVLNALQSTLGIGSFGITFS